ncbi:epoxide hydrolase family protein [Caulobacter sp. KR2-114]|uniref:epoxide hydrolase family protein n=1 Tax=Caulobacter sp. KR2-114 TaxID=3400912 RepID=UPI003C058B25
MSELDSVEAAPIAIPAQALEDLRSRIATTRWPARETTRDHSQGVPLNRLTALVNHWAGPYDWRRCEAQLNAFGPHRTTIDGLGIHFLHVRSRHADALPIILSHGWPGSVLEFSKVIGPLTDPEAHGGQTSDAFHVVVPALPGFGFSDKPTEPGWTLTRTARAWAVLMTRLGYGSGYVAQGGDLGSTVTLQMGQQKPEGLRAIHLNFMPFFSPPMDGEPTEPERSARKQMARFVARLSAYSELQRTRPQTLAYALADSPVAQAAWMYDKFTTPGELGDDPGGRDWVDIAPFDELLDEITLYWLTNSGGSSARMYWESWGNDFGAFTNVDLPVGFTVFPREIFRAPRVWAERAFPNLVHWREVDQGGHFAAWEQPEIFVDELRAAFRAFRAPAGVSQ